MASKTCPGPIQNGDSIREAVCIHTGKIFDSCRDKDCLEDLQFYPTTDSLSIINSACGVRARCAELLYVLTNVENVAFNRGCYAVDMTFFYKIRGEAFCSTSKSCDITGLSVFNKRVILFGSEASAKTFSSNMSLDALPSNYLCKSSMPVAYVEAVDPIILDMKMVDCCNIATSECDMFELPSSILSAFDSPISFDGCQRKVYVSLGQFSIVRLERESQLLVPTYDYCLPEKECPGTDTKDPCALFSQVCFPVEEFFPPDSISSPECYREVLGSSLTR